MEVNTNIDLSNFNTQNNIHMREMFRECNFLSNINLSNLNTQNITYIDFSFRRCNSLIKKILLLKNIIY